MVGTAEEARRQRDAVLCGYCGVSGPAEGESESATTLPDSGIGAKEIGRNPGSDANWSGARVTGTRLKGEDLTEQDRPRSRLAAPR